MSTLQLHTKTYRTENILFEITLVVTLAGLIVFGALATIIKMDGDLIAVESATKPANLPQPERFYQSLSPASRDNRNEATRSQTASRITTWSF